MCKINLLKLGGTGFGWLAKKLICPSALICCWNEHPLDLWRILCPTTLFNSYNEDRQKGKHKVVLRFSGQARNRYFSITMTERGCRIWIQIPLHSALFHSSVIAMSDLQREGLSCLSVSESRHLLSQGRRHAAVSWGVFPCDTVCPHIKLKPWWNGGAASEGRGPVCAKALGSRCTGWRREQLGVGLWTTSHLQACSRVRGTQQHRSDSCWLFYAKSFISQVSKCHF